MNRMQAAQLYGARGVDIDREIAYCLLWHEVVCSCGCCGCAVLAGEQVALWETLRASVDMPVSIGSGYRCLHHPLERVKKRPGMHTLGLALDLHWPPAFDRARFASLVNGIWESGAVILYDWGLHADARGLRYRGEDRSAPNLEHELNGLRQAIGLFT